MRSLIKLQIDCELLKKTGIYKIGRDIAIGYCNANNGAITTISKCVACEKHNSIAFVLIDNEPDKEIKPKKQQNKKLGNL